MSAVATAELDANGMTRARRLRTSDKNEIADENRSDKLIGFEIFVTTFLLLEPKITMKNRHEIRI